MLFDYILLINFKRMKAERSEAAIFHVLKGKKSIQTVQDIHIFELEKFFGIGRFLNKQQFDESVQKLRKAEKVQQIANNNYIVTREGLHWLEENKFQIPLDHYNGFKYERIATTFYERLILLIQTLTNSKMKNYSFIPVIDNRTTKNWVKAFYRKTRDNKREVLPLLYKELLQLLSHCSQREAEIFVDRLSSWHVYGLSINQLATEYDLKNEDISLTIIGTVHYILSMVETQTNEFPLMSHIWKDLMNTTKLSDSAKVTYDLLNKNYSISQIASSRQLKHNTIYDHIVEIAYNDDQFPLAHYVSKDKQHVIIKAIQHSNSFKLKQIKDQLGNEFSYFEIRLVLAANRNLLK